MNRIPSRASLASAVVAAALALGKTDAFAQSASETELARRVDQLAAELAKVKTELAQLQQQRSTAAMPATAASSAAAPGVAAAPAVVAAPATTAQGPGLTVEPATVLGSYAEIAYSRPTHDSKNTVADLARFVLAYQHRFDEKTKAVAEFEVEHAVSSADDRGEAEVEQAYVERQLARDYAIRGGLFLIPAGLLNENHEPTAYYGVYRNFVETAIIPSTWREGGIQIVGAFDNGLTAQAGVTTGFDLNKWDANSSEGAKSPLGSIHQELQLANARDLSVFGALNWRGVPGLLLGGSLFTGGATHGQAPTSARVALWDLHARYTPGRWDLSGVYSRGTISNTAALNAPLVGGTTLIPKSFDGWYGQAAYRVWSNADYSLAPFARYEEFNTARTFADLGPGLTPDAARTERVVTFGANFNIGSGIVVKADYQRFRENRDADRFDLGLGWSF
ncbi:MAG TPA: hypothetical protein VH041_10420 [Caldimonas sp.]|nr:hypothetical protein [Caldimonas sp.]HEX4234711.1 hypothetical protein [Caldimonas sp.]